MRARLAEEGAIFLLAVQFLTRLPVRSTRLYSPARLAATPRWHPAVGLIVGAITGLVFVAAAHVFPPALAALLSTAAGLMTTGCFHEDGFADACDGLGGGATRERALEIMRLLLQARSTAAHGLTAAQLAKALRVSVLGVESTLQALVDLDWVARIEDDAGSAGTRHVLLAEPSETPLEPLAYQLLLHRTANTELWWRTTRVASARLSDVL